MTDVAVERPLGPVTRGDRATRRGRSLRSVTNRGFVGFAVVVGLAIAVVVIACVRLTTSADDQINHYGPALIRANDAFTALLNQETGVRGYAITSDDSYLQPYTDGLASMRTAFGQLEGYLPAGDARARADIKALEAASAAWRTQFAEPVIAATKAGNRAAVARLLSGPGTLGKPLFDKVRQDYNTLSSDTAAKRSEAVTHLRRSITTIIVVIAVGVGLLAVASAFIFLGVRRRVIEPVARLGEETRVVASGGYDHRVLGGGPAEIDDLALDVEAMRRRIVAELEEVEAARRVADRTSASLARSNADLEQFAYVASHDLQEPLRKVSNFCQLLERQYGEELDDRAKQYIAFAVDGAKRMQVLINDLLAFSRVGRNTESFVPVALADAVRDAMDNLAVPLRDTGGEVLTTSELPTVPGDPTLLVTLFQNLIGNALKYHGEDLPRVEISATRRVAAHQTALADEPERHEWVVSVADNGIGIDPQYAQRIFVIFQRLHLRDSYGGTGIGLAMCKKIVEYHGGTIWLEPQAPPGARFSFTVPEGSPA